MITPIILLTGLYFTPIDNPKIDVSKYIAVEKQLTNKELVEKYSKMYGVDTQLALRIGYCESGLRTHAKSKISSASGPYQFIRKTWQTNSKFYGWGGSSVFNSEANISVAMQKMKREGYNARKSSSSCRGKTTGKLK